ncbi:hypothetical protein D3C76_1763760 [compost metagenome]
MAPLIANDRAVNTAPTGVAINAFCEMLAASVAVFIPSIAFAPFVRPVTREIND